MQSRNIKSFVNVARVAVMVFLLGVLDLACVRAVAQVPPDPGTGMTNIAVNPSGSGFPSPLESDPGWGGGSYPWEIVDGLRDYQDWFHGLAFTGGHTGGWGSGGWIEPAGPRQATIDFGQPVTVTKVVIWHHGDVSNHVPKITHISYFDETQWIPIATKRMYGRFYAPGGSDSGYSNSDEYFLPHPVTGTKVRYSFDNRGATLDGNPIVHGWLYEFEVYASNVSIVRQTKAVIERDHATYQGHNYVGFVSLLQDQITFVANANSETQTCWEAQDVIPAGLYSGVDESYHSLGAGNPTEAMHLSGGSGSTIWIHYGFADSAMTAKPWSTGCIVFPQVTDLVPSVNLTFAPRRLSAVSVSNSSLSLSASDYSISGGVVTSTGQPVHLAGVTVTLTKPGGTTVSTVTNAYGHYLFTGTPVGDYVVSAQLQGHTINFLQLMPSLPWLVSGGVTANVHLTGWPPDCYGVDFTVN